MHIYIYIYIYTNISIYLSIYLGLTSRRIRPFGSQAPKRKTVGFINVYIHLDEYTLRHIYIYKHIYLSIYLSRANLAAHSALWEPGT